MRRTVDGMTTLEPHRETLRRLPVRILDATQNLPPDFLPISGPSSTSSSTHTI